MPTRAAISLSAPAISRACARLSSAHGPAIRASGRRLPKRTAPTATSELAAGATAIVTVSSPLAHIPGPDPGSTPDRRREYAPHDESRAFRFRKEPNVLRDHGGQDVQGQRLSVVCTLPVYRRPARTRLFISVLRYWFFKCLA